MTWVSSLFVFFIVWWLVLFTVLPWGVRREENPEPGHEIAAPQNPMMWRKVAATTVITAIIFAGIYVGVEMGWIDFRPD